MERQVKCDCTHPIYSECSRRDLPCEYQKKESSKSDPHITKDIQTEIEPEKTPVLPNDAGGMPSYSCQFSEDYLSILTDTDEVSKAED